MQCASFSILAITADAAADMVPATAPAMIDISGATRNRVSMITPDLTARIMAGEAGQSQQERRWDRTPPDGGSLSSVKNMSAISCESSGAIAPLEAGR